MDFSCLAINQRWSKNYFLTIDLPDDTNELSSDNDEDNLDEKSENLPNIFPQKEEESNNNQEEGEELNYKEDESQNQTNLEGDEEVT